MRCSDIIKALENMKECYGDLEVVLSVAAGEDSNENPVYVQAHGDLEFAYFQVSKNHEIIIIG